MVINMDSVLTTSRFLVGLAVTVAYGVFSYQYGYSSAKKTYQRQIAETQIANLEAARKAQDEARTKEELNAKKVSEALAERDRALASISGLRSNAVRVRQQSQNLSAQLSRASQTHTASGNRDSERLGKCEKLLGESAGLLGEGAELAGEGAEILTRVAADKEAMKATR